MKYWRILTKPLKILKLKKINKSGSFTKKEILSNWLVRKASLLRVKDVPENYLPYLDEAIGYGTQV